MRARRRARAVCRRAARAACSSDGGARCDGCEPREGGWLRSVDDARDEPRLIGACGSREDGRLRSAELGRDWPALLRALPRDGARELAREEACESAREDAYDRSDGAPLPRVTELARDAAVELVARCLTELARDAAVELSKDEPREPAYEPWRELAGCHLSADGAREPWRLPGADDAR